MTNAADKIFADDRISIDADVERVLDRIRALRDEAGSAGDLDQVALCDLALAGDVDAYLKCEASFQV